MLILNRKEGESINIDDHIKIKILEVGRSYVKIGIEAPRTVSVHREEVFERIREENLMAQKATSKGLAEAARVLKKKQTKRNKNNSAIMSKISCYALIGRSI